MGRWAESISNRPVNEGVGHIVVNLEKSSSGMGRASGGYPRRELEIRIMYNELKERDRERGARSWRQ